MIAGEEAVVWEKEYNRVVIRRKSDGRFFRAGHDCADEWVKNPFWATDREGLLMERDANYFLESPDPEVGETELVEFRVTAEELGVKAYAPVGSKEGSSKRPPQAR